MHFVYPAPPMEAWNWIYAVAILMATLMLLGAAVTTRVDPLKAPKSILLLGGIGVLYVIAFPWNAWTLYVLTTLMVFHDAPDMATIMMIVFTIGCWCVAFYTMFLPRRLFNRLR